MKIYTGITGEGISLWISDSAPARLSPSPDADQSSPRRCYVYAHLDEGGTPFYIGKGTGQRGWEDNRHALWHRYVDRHLNGRYTVRILADNLSADEAELLESSWMVQESETLVNWFNFGRKTDFAALERYHALRNANRALIADTRSLEATEPERAVAAYYQAVQSIAAYAKLKTEGGLLGRLIDEERQEFGYLGELAALDRLTLCLVRLGRGAEAAVATEQYFSQFRADAGLRSAEPIRRRVAKANRS